MSELDGIIEERRCLSLVVSLIPTSKESAPDSLMVTFIVLAHNKGDVSLSLHAYARKPYSSEPFTARENNTKTREGNTKTRKDNVKTREDNKASLPVYWVTF
jgi:hypothetical protein